jgi:hypothetical protein
MVGWFGVTTFSKTTLSIKGLYVTLSISDISITMLCHYVEFTDIDLAKIAMLI